MAYIELGVENNKKVRMKSNIAVFHWYIKNRSDGLWYMTKMIDELHISQIREQFIKRTARQRVKNFAEAECRTAHTN